MNFHDLRFSVVNVEAYVDAVVCQVSCSPLDMLETMSQGCDATCKVVCTPFSCPKPCMLIPSERVYHVC